MRRKQEEYETGCAYCVYATVLADMDVCVCQKRGVVRADGSCRKFRLDLLKVKPHLPLLPDSPDPTETENAFAEL